MNELFWFFGTLLLMAAVPTVARLLTDLYINRM